MLGLIDAALQMDRLAMHWKVELSPGGAREFVKATCDEGAYIQREASRLIKLIDAAVPRLCKNGVSIHRYVVGRETCRVIYVTIQKGYLPTDCSIEELRARLVAFGIEAHAFSAEVVTDTEKDLIVRYWWD